MTTFLDRLARVVSVYGARVALLEDGTRSLTYDELWARVSALGARFASLHDRAAGEGAGRETVIGVFVPASIDYVVALLSAWWAGAAFVPILPDLPAERAAGMVRDANAAFVVARGADVARSAALGARVVSLDDDASPATPAPSRAAARESDLAYVIFTSGSTGAPKGVAIEHRGILPFLDAQIAAFALDASSRALLYLSIAFDASISDIGTVLLAGGTLCIETSRDELTRALPVILERRAITHVDLPPSLLVALDPAAMPASLRTVIIGGEPCPPAVVRRWAARLRVVNVYGPTEATVCTSLCVCDATWDRPLIGRAVPGSRVFVGDALGRALPAGTRGELWIGGLGLARGYVAHEALARERFVVVNGERLYRTGDLGAEGARGDIEFLGRIDRQLKVRGQLVAPEEIEARLLSHDDLTSAAVVLRPLAPGGRAVLVAFVVARAGHAVPPRAALDRHLARTLTRWMLPQRYVAIDRVPVGVTGKADYAALAALPIERALVGVPPANDVEARLLEAWRAVLGEAALGVTDDCFELGGDSLAVLEVVAAAGARGVAVSPSAVRDARTVRALAMRAGSDDYDDDEGITTEALRADIARDAPAIASLAEGPRRAHEPAREPACIFVTGATGFLGARVVRELLRRSRAELRLLVRAADVDEARARLREVMRGPLTREDESRVVVLAGDVARERFALDARAWSSLAADADAIVHLAADIGALRSYAELRPANVGSVGHVLALAGTGRAKHVHFASTLSVFTATDRRGTFAEDDDASAARVVYGGYAQSKWAAETRVRGADVASTVYRFSLVGGDSASFATPEDHVLALFVRELAARGAPDDAPADLALNIVPVDYAAAALVHLALAGHGGTFHIVNDAMATLADVVDALLAEDVSLSDPARAPASSASFATLDRRHAHRPLDLFESTGASFDHARTSAALEGSGIACPAPRALLAGYVRYLFRGG